MSLAQVTIAFDFVLHMLKAIASAESNPLHHVWTQCEVLESS